jgi:hypothetical protein
MDPSRYEKLCGGLKSEMIFFCLGFAKTRRRAHFSCAQSRAA